MPMPPTTTYECVFWAMPLIHCRNPASLRKNGDGDSGHRIKPGSAAVVPGGAVLMEARSASVWR